MTAEQLDRIRWLNRAFHAEKAAKAWLAKLERDRSLAERISRGLSSGGGSTGNSTEDALIRLADTERETQERLRELVAIRETDLTYTIKNCIGQEVRFRKTALGKLDEVRVMHLDKPDMAYYLRKLIEAQNHSIMTLIGMIHNEAERLEKIEGMLENEESQIVQD